MENAATTSTACTNPGQVGPNRPCLLEIFSLFVCVCRLPQFQHQRWFGSLPGSSMPGIAIQCGCNGEADGGGGISVPCNCSGWVGLVAPAAGKTSPPSPVPTVGTKLVPNLGGVNKYKMVPAARCARGSFDSFGSSPSRF